MEIEAIKSNPVLTNTQKRVETAILESLNTEEPSENRRIPKSRGLTLAERERFENLMDMNFAKGNKYITLTYGTEAISLDEASKDFENWVKRMRERYGDFKYLAVRSFQERNTPHFHLLANLPRIPRKELVDGTFRDIWGHGGVDFKQIYDMPMGDRRNQLKNYLLKNLREFKADERSYGKRLFLQSKNLLLPETMKGNYDELMESFRDKGYKLKLLESRQFPVEYLHYIRLETHQFIL